MSVNNESSKGLRDWGFIFKHAADEKQLLDAAGFRTRLAGVRSVERAVEITREWATDGVQMIELCGWFPCCPQT